MKSLLLALKSDCSLEQDSLSSLVFNEFSPRREESVLLEATLLSSGYFRLLSLEQVVGEGTECLDHQRVVLFGDESRHLLVLLELLVVHMNQNRLKSRFKQSIVVLSSCQALSMPPQFTILEG